MRARRNPSRAQLARAERLYLLTRTPVARIRASLDLSLKDLYRLVEERGWPKRQLHPRRVPPRRRAAEKRRRPAALPISANRITHMPAPRFISPEVQARARRLYEETDVPVRDIAKLMGIGDNTFYRRLRGWGWQRRKERTSPEDRSALDHAAAKAERGDAAAEQVLPEAKAPAATPSVDLAEMAAQAEQAVEEQLAAVQRLMKAFDARSTQAGQAERAARTLASLSRTLRELKIIRAFDPVAPESNDDDHPRTTEELRRELSRKLEALVARTTPELPDEPSC
jgi:hypothetical protein